MYGQIRPALQERFFNFLGEQAFRAYLVERYRGDFVAGSFDDFDAAFMS